MTTANTRECFSEFVGQKVVGVLFDALPLSRADLRAGTKTLIFEDGRGLHIHSNGSFGIVTKEDVDSAIRATQRRIEATQRDLAGVLDLAGARC